MCGIAGILGAGGEAPSFDALFAAVAHRGPDASGSWRDHRVQMGMHRLVFRGADVPLPIGLNHGVAAFNGQVYGSFANGSWEEAPEGLAAEVTLASHGAADGMYAFSRYDADSGELVLRTDPHFIKPMFLRQANDTFIFCSELRPLLAGHADNRIEADSLAELFAYGWYLSDRSWIRDVSQVWKHDVTISDGHLAQRPALPVTRHPGASPALADFKARIRESVRRSTQGRGPLGLALSGGLDSTILAHELNALGVEDLVCITVQSQDAADGVASLSELGLPERGSWRSWRHVRVPTGDDDFLSAFESSTLEFAQPTTMSSLPLYRRLADAAAEEGVRALILGEGVDEYFGGYSSYAKVRTTSDIGDYYRDERRTRLTRALFGEEAASAVHARFATAYESAGDMRSIEVDMRLTRLLLRSDVCLMGRSIEGRVPFLHNGIPELALAMPWPKLLEDGGKSVLRLAFASELGPRARAPKVRFKAPDALLGRCLARSDVRGRMAAAAGSLFGSRRAEHTLALLADPAGYDADTLCLLLSLTYLVESGIVDAGNIA